MALNFSTPCHLLIEYRGLGSQWLFPMVYIPITWSRVLGVTMALI